MTEGSTPSRTMASPPDVRHIFVYGTLKRGQSRESAWPCAPRSVCPAWTRGTLYDLGDYPALGAGTDCVEGELWELEGRHVSETLAVLDRIEGFEQGPTDLYRRVVLPCHTADWELPAFGYLYVEPLDPAWRILPRNGRCKWPQADPS